MRIQLLSLALLAGPLFGETPDLQQSYNLALEEPESVIFIPPKGWLAADPSILPQSVKAMVIGKSEKNYPPSINIGLEPFTGSLKSYLKNVKMINEAQNATWKDLGQVTTECGPASLSSVDMTTEWGDVKLLHAIIVRYGTAYILTCASLKDEFTTNYKDFLSAIHSLRINKDVYEMVGHPEMRAKLMNHVQKLKKNQETWDEFAENIKTDFSSMGPKWYDAMLAKAHSELSP